MQSIWPITLAPIKRKNFCLRWSSPRSAPSQLLAVWTWTGNNFQMAWQATCRWKINVRNRCSARKISKKEKTRFPYLFHGYLIRWLFIMLFFGGSFRRRWWFLLAFGCRHEMRVVNWFKKNQIQWVCLLFFSMVTRKKPTSDRAWKMSLSTELHSDRGWRTRASRTEHFHSLWRFLFNSLLCRLKEDSQSWM